MEKVNVPTEPAKSAVPAQTGEPEPAPAATQLQNFKDIVAGYPLVNINRAFVDVMTMSPGIVERVSEVVTEQLRDRFKNRLNQSLLEGRNPLEPRKEITIEQGALVTVTTPLSNEDEMLADCFRRTPLTKSELLFIKRCLPVKLQEQFWNSMSYTATEKPVTFRDVEDFLRPFTLQSSEARNFVSQEL